MMDQMAVLEQVVIGGDLSRLGPEDRMTYYRAVCESVGLNPLTRPLEYLNLSGKLVLYARKDATDQLRKIRGVSITKVEDQVIEGIYVVTAYAKDISGREDSEIGAVPIDNTKGEQRANAMMKAHTKAKRRVTLSICGLGMLDETEVDSIPGAKRVDVDPNTGELPEKVTTHAQEGEEMERESILAQIKDIADRHKMSAQERAKVWAQYAGEVRDPRIIDVSILGDMFRHLKSTYGE